MSQQAAVEGKHYKAHKIEPIEVIEDWKLGFNLGNAVKYIGRHEHKGSALDDLKKARWYLDREIANREAAVEPLPEPPLWTQEDIKRAFEEAGKKAAQGSIMDTPWWQLSSGYRLG